jgi:hypothetical protein
MAKIRHGYQYFTSSDLATIKRNTNQNRHTENLHFIAQKLGAPIVPIKELLREQERHGYLVTFEARNHVWRDLKIHMQHKLSRQEYAAVYSRM